MRYAPSLRTRLRTRGLDGVTLLVLPGVLFVVALFVYPFLYGLLLSFEPKEGGWLANYVTFFSDPFLYDTIGKTLLIAVPATVLNVVLSIPVAMRVRLMRHQKLLTTILVIPITLGTVLIAEGLLTYLGPRGWVNRVLLEFGLAAHPIRLVHNYWGVMLSLIISGFPFTRMADLSQTAIILPDSAGTAEYSAYLGVLGRLSESTGYPALNVTVARWTVPFSRSCGPGTRLQLYRAASSGNGPSSCSRLR
ncbi:MAG: cellulose biosynthesis cyclic di-GMP-binding regulatory protein BcsB [Rhodospirillales bacterium]|nr:cellulose biosynthesis cyclic di-GMP-binding regulatory protein BcsB [Rhodospirillales bacterium]